MLASVQGPSFPSRPPAWVLLCRQPLARNKSNGLLEGREALRPNAEVALLYLYFSFPLFILHAGVLGAVGGRTFAPAKLLTAVLALACRSP